MDGQTPADRLRLSWISGHCASVRRVARTVAEFENVGHGWGGCAG